MPYGADLIWEQLSVKFVENLETVKSMYMKIVQWESVFTPSKLMWFNQKIIPGRRTTAATKQASAEENKEKRKVDLILLDGSNDKPRMDVQYIGLRRVAVRKVAHDFYCKICVRKEYHSSNENCICELFGNVSKRHRITKYLQKKVSLIDCSFLFCYHNFTWRKLFLEPLAPPRFTRKCGCIRDEFC
jgi:hypothetical protein